MRVFSFVAPSQRGSFSGDLKAFYNHLIQNNGFPGGSQYLISKFTSSFCQVTGVEQY